MEHEESHVDCLLCPECGRMMVYAWPSPQSDAELEKVVGNFQCCKNKNCKFDGLIDVRDGHRFFVGKMTFAEFHYLFVVP